VVALAELQRVLAERHRHLVHVALQGEEALRAPVAAERAATARLVYTARAS
jgi:hypothetical protein